MRQLAVAVLSFLLGGVAGASLIAGNTVSAQSPAPPVGNHELTRESAARIIVAAIDNAEETVPVELGACTRQPDQTSCGLLADCAPTLSLRDAATHATDSTRGLFQHGLIERVDLRLKMPIIGYQNAFMCHYKFTLTAEAEKLVREHKTGDDVIGPHADAIAYKKRFAGITSVFDSDDKNKLVEYLVTYEPTIFANALSSTSVHRRHGSTYTEVAHLTLSHEGWRFVNFAR